MDKLKKKVLNYRKLASEFSVYFNKFSETVGRYYEDEVKECRGTLATYVDEIDSLTKIPKALSSEDIFNLVHIMSHLDLIINRIQTHFEYFNPGKHRFTNDVSTTYLSETTAMFDSVIVLICQLRKKNKLYDSDIIIHLGAQIMREFDLSDPMEFFKKIQSYYHEHTNAVNLYAYVIQSLLDRLFAEGPEYKVHAYAIMNELEKDKNQALSEKHYSPEFNGITHNPALMSFGLIPITNIMSMRDVIYAVFDRNIPDDVIPDTILLELCAESNGGLIIYRKLTRKPISYNIQGLTARDKKSSDSGIDIELVHKLKTIDVLPVSQYDFQITRCECDDRCQSVLILDELAESQYKIMAPWETKNYLVPKHAVSDFIEFSKKGFIDKPARMEQYNKLMIKKMLGNMFLDRRANMVQISEKSQVDEIKYLRNELYLRLMDHYRDIMETQYDSGKAIKNNVDLTNIINNPSIKDVFTESLIKNYYAFLKKNEYINEMSKTRGFVFNEVIATFLAQLHVINRGFVREIFSHSESHMPDVAIYLKPAEFVYLDIKDVIDKIVKNSLLKVLSDKTNIYQSLVFKTMLLQVPAA